MTKKLIIAATSARGYAQAAVLSGYKVITLDAFADEDTRQISTQTFKMKTNESGVDAYDFKRIFLQMDIDHIDGFLYGSLFDAVPDLLSWVAMYVPLIGNTPEVMRVVKEYSFFKLLDDLQIRYPEVSLKRPAALDGWIAKKIGSTGGAHIQPASQYSSADYFQCEMAGVPVSMLFVADSKTAHTIGFNQQFVAPVINMPYRFAGAVSGVNFTAQVQQQFCHAAQQLTTALGLRGINSLDAILDGETLWILELNPRLSFSFHLYPNLLPLHLQGCAGDLSNFSFSFNHSSAQLIIYADETLAISTEFVWPDWVADIPSMENNASNVKIARNAPICTVLAEGENASSAQTLVLQRAQKLREMLFDD